MTRDMISRSRSGRIRKAFCRDLLGDHPLVTFDRGRVADLCEVVDRHLHAMACASVVLNAGRPGIPYSNRIRPRLMCSSPPIDGGA
ncbi:hypothetical protein ACIGO9_19630 [Nocardia asteroides]|uniref:hypothetical protein n=1 Tax=Nocardia asteroides TaxID=1824 RepID=UPI0037C4FE55